MSALSDQLVTLAILAYLVAMISHAVEYALGNQRSSVRAAAPARELVGAGVGASGAVQRPAEVASAAPKKTDPGERARLAGRLAVWLTVVGALVHLGGVVTRGVAAERMPWGNMYEFVLTGTFIAVTGWLVVLYRRPTLRRLGLFLTLALVLLLAVAQLVIYVPVTPLIPALKSYWFYIHVSTIMFSSGLLLLGAVPAAAYLMRAGYEAGRRGFPYSLAVRLPAASALERLTFGMHAFAFPLFTFAVIAGAIWAEAAWGRSWGWDPKETWAFISWVVYAGYLHGRATPSMKRNIVAWMALLGFVTMLINLFGVNLFISSLHSYAGVN